MNKDTRQEEKYIYDAFISYRHKTMDITIAKRLHKLLESYKIPHSIKKRTGIKKINRIFRDQDELPTSSNLSEDINNALKTSRFLIVICSTDTPKSKWCNQEIETFRKYHGNDRILSLLIEGEPEEAFPRTLRYFTIMDGTAGESVSQEIEMEPLAADIRASSINGMLRKLQVEKLRLLAPMLNVGFDDLKQRHREQRVKKAMGMVIAISLLFSCFGAYALYQSNIISAQSNELKKKNDKITENNSKLIEVNQQLQDQIDETTTQRNLAQKNSEEAKAQAEIADRNAALATENEEKALKNMQEAQYQKSIAQANEILATKNEKEAMEAKIVAEENYALANKQKEIIIEKTNQILNDYINLKIVDINVDIDDSLKFTALNKMAKLWVEHSNDEYSEQILDGLKLSAIRANYAQQFTTWEKTSVRGGTICVSEDKNTVAVFGYPKDGKISMHTYDRWLTDKNEITLQFDDSYGKPSGFKYLKDHIVIDTDEGDHLSYDFQGNLISKKTTALADDMIYYNEIADKYRNSGTFYRGNIIGMYSKDDNRMAVLYSKSSTSDYDPISAGGFVIYDIVTKKGNTFMIPSPAEITDTDMFSYDQIRLLPNKNVVLISLNRGIYETYITAYSTITGKELCTVNIDGNFSLLTDCIFSALDQGYIMINGAIPGDWIPFISFFSIPEEQSLNWSYSKRIFDKKTYIQDMVSCGDTLYLLTDREVQAIALQNLSLSDKLAGKSLITEFDQEIASNSMVETSKYGISIPEQSIEIDEDMKLNSTGQGWYYGDKFYTGIKIQLDLTDKNGNDLFTMQQTDLDTYPYYSQKDKVIGFISYDNQNQGFLLPLKGVREIFNTLVSTYHD